MSFHRYERYKESGVEWLGEVPEGWDVKRLKLACEVFPSNVDKKSYDDETPVKLCNYTDVYYNEQITPDLEFMVATASPAQIKKFTLRAGDTIITKDSETADDIAIASYIPQDLPDVICGYHLSMVRPREGVFGAFVKRLFDSNYAKSKFAVLANGLTRVGLGQYALDNVYIPLPSLPEQQTIAAFLDRETGKIDELVAEQERLIALLKEKRQAVISHAVTKGLNPDAPMKNSGIEWLGEVPVGWECGPLKRFAQVIDCKHYTVTFLDNGWPIVSIRELRDDKIDLSNAKMTSKEEWDFLREGRIPAMGDMIFCRNASVGALGYVETDEPLCMGQDVCLIRPDFTGKFMHYLLTSRFVKEQIEALLVGATIRRANVEEIRNLVTAIPPPDEQSAIATFLDSEISKIDALVGEAQQAIGLLKERRSALISAAVTGKIDVRNSDRSDKSDLSEGFCQTDLSEGYCQTDLSKGCQTT